MRLLWEEKKGENKHNIEGKKEKIQENKKAHYRRKGEKCKKENLLQKRKKPKEKKRLVAREK